MKNNIHQRRKGLAYFLSLAALVAAMILGVSIGTVYVPMGSTIRILLHSAVPMVSVDGVDPMHLTIVSTIRLPRVILAAIVGASLAVAGAAFQGLLRNPLADPYTLGVSSGASVGAVVTLFFHLTLPIVGGFTLPTLSILGSFVTVIMVLLFASKIERSLRVETIILTGIIFSSFLGACISLMIALTGEQLRQIIGWLLGSVSMRGWEYIHIILPFFVVGTLVMMWNGRELNAMSFGEERAQHLGVDVQKRKYVILFAGSLLTGSAVAVSGTIGFVGLVVPHVTRKLWGPDHRHLIPLSMLIGSAFLIIADLVSRTIIAPIELPIGVITAIIGAPVFAMILLHSRKERR